MLKTVEVPVNYKYVIDRVIFEMNIQAKNLAFMLHRNLDNPDFLNSELYERLDFELVDTFLNRWVVLEAIFNEVGAPQEGKLDMDCVTGRYYITWYVEGDDENEETNPQFCSNCRGNNC